MCATSSGPCELDATCDGQQVTCPARALKPASVVCRVPTGECDAPERCTGMSAACPPDKYVIRCVCGLNHVKIVFIVVIDSLATKLCVVLKQGRAISKNVVRARRPSVHTTFSALQSKFRVVLNYFFKKTKQIKLEIN